MEALANVVFERTPKGAVAIKSTSDEVPRRLRTLLLAIDGRSPVAQYVPFLTAFAPLSEKFAELEGMGFLQRKGRVAAEAVDRFERAQNSGFGTLLPRIDAAAPDSGFMPIQESDLRALASNTPARQNSSVADAFELELQALARQMSGAAASGAPAASPPADVRANPAPAITTTRITAPAKPQLPDLLHEMERFLSKSAGTEALPIVLMLEQIKNIAQLRAELPAYVEVVQRYGPEAHQHIGQLTKLLDQAGD